MVEVSTQTSTLYRSLIETSTWIRSLIETSIEGGSLSRNFYQTSTKLLPQALKIYAISIIFFVKKGDFVFFKKLYFSSINVGCDSSHSVFWGGHSLGT